MLTKYFLLFALVLTYSVNPVPLVHAQDDNPPGFVSIDCGLPEGSDYKESTTGLYYKSDAKLIDSGESKNVSTSLIGNSNEKYLSTVRSFPRGKKNCYTIQPSPGKGTRYLIRASFRYGNYDSLNQFPTFDLNLGADTWSKIEIQENARVVRKEMIHILSSDYIHVCLIKTGTTTPFISALELRPLITSTKFAQYPNESLLTFSHINCDDTTTSTPIRYKDDIYDRIWTPFNMSHTIVSTSLDVNINDNDFQVPMDVLRTASTPDKLNDPLQFSWDTTSASDQFYLNMYIAEVEKLDTNQSREFDIYLNGYKWTHDKPIRPTYRGVAPYFPKDPWRGETKYIVTFNKTERSTLPPIINAYEIYTLKNFSNSGTNETDVAAILDIKSKYGVLRDTWQGDPCEPEDFIWEGLKCSNHSSGSARITTLNLSASGLTGEIVSSIADLTHLETLDLSNNSFSGQVPGFLSQLTSLSVLNLKGNNFTGPIPAQLLENKNEGILSLSFDGPGNDKNKKKSNKSTTAVVGAVVGSLIFLAAVVGVFGIWIMRRTKSRGTERGRRPLPVTRLGNQPQENNSEIERPNIEFTYSEVRKITEDFGGEVLGQGGFGKVYLGRVGDIQVAVKMLYSSSPQDSPQRRKQCRKQFKTEATLLMRISHKNLISLVGYCNEDENMGIIYEYMAKGSLDKHLSGRTYGILSWEDRLRIALEAAQGLEYLHHGCKPAIIHRDVKTSNILLNEKLEAKLSDFGLSRAYSIEDGTHTTTVVAGTPGYLDPDYVTSQRLTEKSDVYSFGVVLLVMITGQPATSRTEDIAQWVDSIVQHGDVKQVVDPRLEGKFDVNCVWKAVELAMTCASRIPSRRPTMNMVVIELKECLAIEQESSISQTISHDGDPYNSIGTMDLESSLVPR